jgi:uncharacterized protein YciW
MTAQPWYALVPPATLDRFVALVREARRLGRGPRTLLSGSDRARLDQVEAELDLVVERLRPAVAAAGAPALVADTVELVGGVRDLQRYYRRTLDPMMRRELPPIEAQLDERLESLADVVGVFGVGAEGGAR